jgi:hypothetical protein
MLSLFLLIGLVIVLLGPKIARDLRTWWLDINTISFQKQKENRANVTPKKGLVKVVVWMLTGLLLLLLVSWLFVKNWPEGEKTPQAGTIQTRVVMQKQAQPEKVVVKVPERKIQWEMWWVKNPDEPGRNPDKTSGRFRVEMIRNDEQVFDFIQFYQDWGKEKTSHFIWDRQENPKYGIWKEASTGFKGRWYLKKIPGKKNEYFGGASSLDEADDYAPLYLSGN